jgi:hypothetical protein
MGIIRCTAKLLTELKSELTIEPSQCPSWYDWHANLLWVDRKKCILFTNDQSLYSFFVHPMKKPSLEKFAEVFRLGLFKSLMGERLSEQQVEYVLSKYGHIVIGKTNNRSVLGSMNDIAFQIKSMAYAMGGLARANLSELGRGLNRIPMSAIKYKTGVDELKRMLADVGN